MKPLITSLLGCLALAASGCGGSVSSSQSVDHQISLKVTVAPGFIANAHAKIYTLSCSPPSGNVPDPGAACTALPSHRALLVPITCPLTPDTGGELVTGTMDAVRINLRLGSSGACGARWHSISTLLGIPAGE